jgi:hypothetical protein
MDVPGAVPSASTTPPAQPTAPAPVPAAPSIAPVSASTPAPADKTVAPIVAKLFNAAAANVGVSFQVQGHDVVTVFTDKSTGKEIIQFPSKEMIAFGELLDKDAGKVLDKSG